MIEDFQLNPYFPLYNYIRPAFSKEVKRRVNEEQNYECAMCHHRVTWMGPHHIIPERALLRRGIKGKDIRENAVGFCSGEWGRGFGSPDDHHEIADQMAIRYNRFWHNGRFVDLSEIDPSTYIKLTSLPEPRHHYKKHREKGHRYSHYHY